MKFNKRILSWLRMKLFADQYAALSRHVILAEYPKCGGTFVHSLINQALLSISLSDATIYSNNHVSTLNYSPDIDMILGKNLRSTLSSFRSSPLLLKTHKHYNKNMTYILCLYRDPVEVMVSYFNMLFSYGYNSTFDNFVRSKMGIKEYCNFYQSYLDAPQSSRILFIDYKDLVGLEATKILKDIFALFYGMKISDEIAKSSIESCRKKCFQDVESRYQPYDFRRKQFKHVNFISNKSALTIDQLDCSIKDYIYDYVASSLPIFRSIFQDE